MRVTALGMALLLAAACGTSTGGSDAVDLGIKDPGGLDPAPADPGLPPDPGPSDPGPSDPGPADLGPADSGGLPGDPGPADVFVPPPNTPPRIDALPPLGLDMGTSTTVDLNPRIDDDEDGDPALVLEWSAEHVAMKDGGDHVLYVVAPTTWFGVEDIVITVKDRGGLTASATLTVTVKEVTVKPPPPPDECGKVTFSYPAGAGSHTVLLNGTFNGWGKTSPSDVLTDPDGDGTWTVVRQLDPGVYQYKFVVDGQWKADPANPNQTPDGYGGINSVIQVAPCAQ